MGTSTAAPERKGFPRLVELINVDKIPKPRDQGAAEVLKMIAFRMNLPLDGLWSAGEYWNLWNKQWNIYDPDAHPMQLKILKSGRPLLEEQWARGISELLLGTAYDGPDVETGNAVPIQDIYKSFCEGAQPFVAVCCACQMLVSYTVLSRGYGMPYVNNAGIDCDGNDGLKVFTSEGGHWDKGGPLRFADAMKAAHPLQQGSCYSWVGRDPDGTKQKGSHVVSILRVDTDGKKQAQLFDTGAAQDAPRPAPSCAPKWDYSGNYDNEGSLMVRSFIPGSKTDAKIGGRYGGLGTPAARSDAQLQAGIDRMKKTRPYGLARLFVATLPFSAKTKKKVRIEEKDLEVPEGLVFMSRLLRMWGADETANYTIARCQYALRSLPDWKPPETPGTPEQEAKTFRTVAWWVFYSPRGDLATVLMQEATPRAKRLVDLGSVSVGEPLLVVSSLENGRTDWTYVRRALAPATIGTIPDWMKALLKEVGPHTVYNPEGVAIPGELDDNG